MEEVNVSFCSPMDLHGELCDALRDLLDVYHEGEPVASVEFRRPEDGDEGKCTELHIEVTRPFSDQLREDVAATIREHHQCDVVVGEYDTAADPDFVHGNCRVE